MRYYVVIDTNVLVSAMLKSQSFCVTPKEMLDIMNKKS